MRNSVRQYAVANQQLEIEKLHDAMSGTEEEELAYRVNAIKEDKEAEEEELAEEEDGADDAPEDDGEGSPDDTPDGEPVDDSDDEDASVGEVATEAMMSLYVSGESADMLYPHIREKLPDAIQATKDGAEEAVEKTGGVIKRTATAVVDAAKWLKDVGVAYGPGAAKAVFKTIYGTLSVIARVLVSGGTTLSMYVKRRVQSTTNVRKDLEALKAVIANLDDFPDDLPSYDKESIAKLLSTKGTVDLAKSTEVVYKLLQHYFSNLDARASATVDTLLKLMKSVIEDGVESPEELMVEQFRFPGFVKKHINGYSPDSEHLDTYVYEQQLPGDRILVGYMPKHDLPKEAIHEAYANTKVFFGIDSTAYESSKIPPVDKAAAEQLLDNLLKIVSAIEQHEKIYNSVLHTRNRALPAFRAYATALAAAKDKVSVYQSLVKYVELKLRFLDGVYITPSMRIHDFAIQYVLSVSKYLHFLAKTSQENAKDE